MRTVPGGGVSPDLWSYIVSISHLPLSVLTK